MEVIGSNMEAILNKDDYREFTQRVDIAVSKGQEVPHVHVHVLPRTENDAGSTLASMWPTSGIVEPDHAILGSLAEKIRMGA